MASALGRGQGQIRIQDREQGEVLGQALHQKASTVGSGLDLVLHVQSLRA